MDLYEAVETICKDYCKYPDIESGNRLADICDKCPMNKCEELRWADRKDEQTERIKTLDYCDICNHEGCDNCIANNLDDYCVPSGYEPTTQTETQNSNLTFEKRTMRDCYNCKKFETEDECIECHYEPKDEPQTEAWKEPFETDCSWK